MASDIKEEEFLRTDQEQAEEGLPEDLIEEIDHALGEAVLGLDSNDTPFGDASDASIHSTEIHFELDQDASFAHDTNFGFGEMQQILMDMMNMTLRPLARYMKAFQNDEPYEETLDLCELLISPLIPQLETAMLTQPMEDLAFFKSVVLFARNETDPQGRKIMKNVVYRAYTEVQKTFALRYRGSKRAVRNLITFLQALRANPSIKEDDIKRFFAIGVPSLTWVRRTSSKDLTSLSGIPVGKIRMIRTLAKEQSKKRIKPITFTDRLAPAPTRKPAQAEPLTAISSHTSEEEPFILDPEKNKSVDINH